MGIGSRVALLERQAQLGVIALSMWEYVLWDARAYICALWASEEDSGKK